MTSAAELALATRREALRAQLQAQRSVIAQRLGIEPGPQSVYPRSKTMLLLTRHPTAIFGALSTLASLFRRR